MKKRTWREIIEMLISLKKREKNGNEILRIWNWIEKQTKKNTTLHSLYLSLS